MKFPLEENASQAYCGIGNILDGVSGHKEHRLLIVIIYYPTVGKWEDECILGEGITVGLFLGVGDHAL